MSPFNTNGGFTLQQTPRKRRQVAFVKRERSSDESEDDLKGDVFAHCLTDDDLAIRLPKLDRFWTPLISRGV